MADIQILIVEDNPHLLELYRSALRTLAPRFAQGVRVSSLVAGDGAEALKLLDRGGIHLAMVDLFLPNVDGWQLIEKIRADPRHQRLPILVITAGDDREMERALGAGANRCMQKPVQMARLFTAITELVTGIARPTQSQAV